MRVNVVLPFSGNAEFLSAAAMAQVGAAVEKAGFHAGVVTDHPCPPRQWLDAGGDPAPGPLVALAMLAMVTARLRLQTSVLVLPYRNPFGVARDVATLDRVSGGRVILGVGAGYLEEEYRAMGVSFERRNALMDEYIRALRLSLSGEVFSFECGDFVAREGCIAPSPLQKPVPLYVGGNSKRAIRRAVELGDGWNPFFTGHDHYTADFTRTSDIANDGSLAAALAYLRTYSERQGREEPPQVELGGANSPREDISSQQLLDRLCRYRALGVSASSVLVHGRTLNEWCDNAERMGEEVVAKL